MKGISAVIPNYNGTKLFAEVLPHLFTALKNTGLEYEVIVSDDCSTDESVTVLKKDFPSVIIIENKINRGFSPAINAGIKVARYDYVLLMNSDVKLTADYFSPLLKYFELPDTFGVMGRIIGWDNDIIQDGGKYPYFHGKKIKTSGNYIPLEIAEHERFYSMYLSGANALVCGKKLKELGAFNEIFAPFYVEDYELSIRAWRLGYKCYYEHTAICRHKESVSIKSKESKSRINTIYYRNKMFLHAIHLPEHSYKLWYVQNTAECLFQFIIGKKYYLDAFRLFKKEKDKWKQSKQEFERLNSEKNKHISIKDVADNILNSLKDKKLHRF